MFFSRSAFISNSNLKRNPLPRRLNLTVYVSICKYPSCNTVGDIMYKIFNLLFLTLQPLYKNHIPLIAVCFLNTADRYAMLYIRKFNSLIELIEQKATDKLIFPNSNGELLRNGNFTRLWDKYRAETGLNITPHQLRHAYATTLYDAGIDIKTAQYLLGHANIQTTMDIYTHLSQSRQDAAADILNKFVSNL